MYQTSSHDEKILRMTITSNLQLFFLQCISYIIQILQCTLKYLWNFYYLELVINGGICSMTTLHHESIHKMDAK